jgi:hypothetical protein
MNVLRSRRLAWTLILAAVVSFAQQPATTNPSVEEPQGKGQISGSVVSAKTGELLKGAAVSLQGVWNRQGGDGTPLQREAWAGLDGRFVFSEIPSGEYALLAHKAGYGSEFFYRPHLRLRLGAAESRNDVVIRLQPSAVVTGRVIDAYGEPLAGAQVYALTRRVFPNREPRWMAQQRAATNDLGEYRLHALDAGKYVLAVQAPQTTTPRGVGYTEFSPGYYPGANSLDQATALKLGPGAELNGIDFRLELAPDTLVRGVVIDAAKGEPCGECGLQVGDDNVMGFDFPARTTKEGLFVIRGLKAGAHAFLVRPYGGGGGGRPRMLAEQVQVPASGEVEIKLIVGGSQAVSGECILEDPPEQQEAPAAQNQQPGAPGSNAVEQRRRIAISLEPLGILPFPGGRGSVPPEGGPFELADVSPGDYRIRVYGAAGDGYLRSVSLGERELNGPEISIPRDAPLSGLKLRIAFDGAAIRGVVKPAANERPAEQTGELLVSAVPDAGASPYATRGMARAEFDGSFVIRGLVPGSYTLFAVATPMLNIDDPDVRRALKPYSKQISVGKKEEGRVELTAVPESVELW